MRQEQLERLNPWLDPLPLQPLHLTPSEIEDLLAPAPRTGYRSEPSRKAGEARRRFHLSLLAQGGTQWNRWSAAMAVLRPSARDRGDATLFALASHVDLSGEGFVRPVNISGFVFPGDFSLDEARFEAELFASGVTVLGRLSVRNAIFLAGAWLDQATFAGSCDFAGSTLKGRVEARASLYRGPCAWRGARFGRDCWFVSSRFEQRADFSGVTFESDAGFGSVHFGGEATFEQAVFADTLGMESCVFEGSLNFERASFEAGVFLRQARFAEEPRIARASFTRAPVLDDAQFPEAIPGAPAIEHVLSEVAARLG